MSMKRLMAKWGSGANEIDAIRADPATMALLTMNHALHHILDGGAFHGHYARATANTDDHRTGIGFTTPNTVVEGHLVIQVAATHPAEVFVLEAPTIDADPGTNIASVNRNRRGTPATSVMGSLESTPTAGEITTLDETEFAAATFSGGTELDYMLIAGGEGPKAVGGDSREAQEWILKKATKYVIYIQNIGANVNTHAIRLDWHEDTPLH